MSNILDHSQPNQKYFEEISQIPRKSFYEKAISDYIVDFARNRKLWYFQDDIGNVIIKKKASPGYEASQPVMLQAHLDMVCEKEAGSSFDFIKDPIQIYLEEGWVKAKGTTLGADDGAGLALMLGILDDASLKHPEIECLFTVQEEDGMGGALQLDYSPLKSKKLIALDGLQEGSTILSTSGLRSGYIVKKLSFHPNTSPTFSLKVQGLIGGHAALNMGRELGNAISITGRILYGIQKILTPKLVSLQGGSILNGIPQECHTIFALDYPEVRLQEIINTIYLQLKDELKNSDPDLEVVLKKIDRAPLTMGKDISKELIDLLFLLPVGVAARSTKLLDLTLLSRNMGTISSNDKEVAIGYACRGLLKSQVNNLVDQLSLLAEKHHGLYQEKFSYSGYTMSPDSPLVKLWEDVYRESTGKELVHAHIHSGTDAGTICEKMGGMEVIVLMPNTLNVHSPEEKMELASFDRTFQYLKTILERL